MARNVKRVLLLCGLLLVMLIVQQSLISTKYIREYFGMLGFLSVYFTVLSNVYLVGLFVFLVHLNFKQ